MIARRRLIALAALAAVVVAVAFVVERPVAADGATVTRVTIKSREVHGGMGVTLVTPAGGGRGRPLLVFLHGRGGDQDSELSDQFFAALRALGPRAPDVAFPAGGDHSYWHDRAGGNWGRYVIKEVIPTAVRLLGADSRRVAIGGISMGGFGAYDIARLNPGRFCAVGGHSAAIWPRAGLTAPGAFDDAQDFAHHDLIGWARAHPGGYGRTRLWLDGGDADPFHAADEEFASALHIEMHVWPGGHDGAYWDAHWGRYLGFYASALRSCRR